MAYVGMFLLSLFVALLAALQLADYFGATDEFAIILIAIPAFTTFAMLALSAAMRFARSAAAIDGAAALLALLAFAPLALYGGIAAPSGPGAEALTGLANRAILIELIVPGLLAVLVLWGLMRRRWLQLRGEGGISRWPWIATALAGFAILNPGGLELLGQAFSYQGSDALRGVARTATFGGLGLLASIVLIESWVRGRMHRRTEPAPG